VGKTIRHAHVSSKRVTRGDWARTAESLTGATIRTVRRQGKQIFVELDRGTLYIHLGMTGKLLWNASPGKYTRAVLEFDDGTLLYDDVRQFGRVEFYSQLPPALSGTGPDALTVSFEDFYARLKKHRVGLKALLLNQQFISGVGNIYADEALFLARIHPEAPSHRISKRRAVRLHGEIVEVLKLAIQHRGSSISDYVDSAGNRGAFQQLHNVYGRAGEPCPRCGGAVKRIVVAQRGTHYCPRCQRA